MSLKKEIKKTFIPWKNWLRVQAKYYFSQPQKTTITETTNEVIASITSYPARFKSLHLTLKSLVLQKQPANKILLWIAYEDQKALPKNVLQLAKQGLIEICYTEDTRSYKKIIPTLKQYPNATIVTFDDDVYYPDTVLSSLISWHLKFPGRIIANRTHIVMTSDDGQFLPYKQWKKNASNTDCPNQNFQTGIGGVLYPANALHHSVLDETLFTKLAPHGDDIWLYWMTRLNGNIVIKTDNDFEFYHWPFSQKFALYKQNVRQDGNDQQVQAMLEHFGSPLTMPIKNP